MPNAETSPSKRNFRGSAGHWGFVRETELEFFLLHVAALLFFPVPVALVYSCSVIVISRMARG